MQADHEIADTNRELLTAIEELDRPRVEELSRRLIEQVRGSDAPFPVDQAKWVLGQLRKKRFFSQMQRVADAVIQSEQADPQIRRQYAQALIDQGALAAAAAVLLPLPDHVKERAEARGLMGRIHKQRYVDAVPCRRGGGSATARDARVLNEAIRWYHDAYLAKPKDNYWHGINAVACAARARRDGVALDAVVDPDKLAKKILRAMKAKPDPDAWELATAIEAAVALGDRDTALARAHMYVKEKDADAFEIGSTLRQLEEVWCLDSTGGMGALILPVLRNALLERENGGIEISPAEAREAATQLEKVFGSAGFTSLDTYATGMKRARTVARLGRQVGGVGDGTGFLVRGCDLSPRYAHEPWLLLTNAHVVSTDRQHRPALNPAEAVITFEALPLDPADQKTRSYRVEDVLRVSGPAELDFALIKLRGSVADLADDDHCVLKEEIPEEEQKRRTYIIGHPGGASLSYSIQDNLLIDHDEVRIHYRTPTRPGSSGSPVYNDRWELIGLHHAGSERHRKLRDQPGTYEANEGIRIGAIRRVLDKDPTEGSTLR